MTRLDHMMLPVSDWRASRDFYLDQLGFTAEFDLPEGGPAGLGVAAVQDDAGLTIFLEQQAGPVALGGGSRTLKVDDVEAFHRRLAAAGIRFLSPPAKQYWGYGATLADPDGHIFHVYDERSMREKG
jgi:catechol 2,3-dioxygenase-like lactoylglutathione lyase family enzyme